MSTTSPAQPEMTPKAAAAFAAYVAMGEGRSIRSLAANLVQQNCYKTTATAERVLNTWSVKYRWQKRIAVATTKTADDMLAEAAELDAATFFLTSQKLHERVKATSPADSEVLVRIRESVRKPAPKGGVHVNISVEVQRLVDRVAAEDGMTEDERAELLASVQRHLDGPRA